MAFFAIVAAAALLCVNGAVGQTDFYTQASLVRSNICDQTRGINSSMYVLPAATKLKYSAFLQIFTDMRFQCTGRITQLAFVVQGFTYSQPVYIDFWRPSGDNYNLVGSYRIVPLPSTSTLVQILPIPIGSQINIQMNDVLGMHYDDINLGTASTPIPYLEAEDAPILSGGVTAAYTTRLWRLQQSNINGNYQVSTSTALALSQRRLPGILVYVETSVVATNPPIVISGAEKSVTKVATIGTTLVLVIVAIIM